MEVIFEIIFQMIFEVILEVFAEILVEMGFVSAASVFRNKKSNPILGVFGYIIFGLILGGLSLLIFPDPIIKNTIVKVIYFIVSPLLIGFSLCLFSMILKKHTIGENFLKVEKFVYGCFFALSYSLIRIFFTN